MDDVTGDVIALKLVEVWENEVLDVDAVGMKDGDQGSSTPVLSGGGRGREAIAELQEMERTWVTVPATTL